jgi:hypothetical protein
MVEQSQPIVMMTVLLQLKGASFANLHCTSHTAKVYIRLVVGKYCNGKLVMISF